MYGLQKDRRGEPLTRRNDFMVIDGFAFRRVAETRLLDEDVLPGLQGLQGPLVVKTTGQRYVNTINVWVVEDLCGYRKLSQAVMDHSNQTAL